MHPLAKHVHKLRADEMDELLWPKKWTHMKEYQALGRKIPTRMLTRVGRDEN